MRYSTSKFGMMLFLVLLVQGCTSALCIFKGYSARNIRDTCVTGEPGTYMNSRCNLVTRMASEYKYNPDSAFAAQKRLIKMVTKNIRKVDNINIPVDGGSIRLRIYNDMKRPVNVAKPVVIYYHGGGFQRGTLESFDYYTRKLANSMDAIVIAVDYRLAPEFIFPTAVNDSYESLLWVSANIAAYGGDPASIFVMGGSAGANLAAVMPIVSHDRNGPGIAGQILCYPAVTFLETEFPSRNYFLTDDGKYLLTMQFLLDCKNAYLGNIDNESNPYASPLNAEFNFTVPEALVITAQCDPLRDEGRAYAQKLSASGASVSYLEYEGMIHAFMPLYPLLKEGRRAIREVSHFVEGQ